MHYDFVFIWFKILYNFSYDSFFDLLRHVLLNLVFDVFSFCLLLTSSLIPS